MERVNSDSQDEFPMYKKRVGWEASDIKTSTSSSALLYDDEESHISQLNSVFVAYNRTDENEARFVSRLPTAVLVCLLLIIPPGYIFGMGCWAIPLLPPMSPINVWHIVFLIHVQLISAHTNFSDSGSVGAGLIEHEARLYVVLVVCSYPKLLTK